MKIENQKNEWMNVAHMDVHVGQKQLHGTDVLQADKRTCLPISFGCFSFSNQCIEYSFNQQVEQTFVMSHNFRLNCTNKSTKSHLMYFSMNRLFFRQLRFLYFSSLSFVLNRNSMLPICSFVWVIHHGRAYGL